MIKEKKSLKELIWGSQSAGEAAVVLRNKTLFIAKAKTVKQTLGQLLKLQQKVQGGQKVMSKSQER